MNNRNFKEQKFWDSFAKKYDKNNHKQTNETYIAVYKKFLEDIAGAKNMLEIATGTGLISLKLSSIVPEITAIDLSPEMLKIAKQKAIKQLVKNIDFSIGDICNLKFPDNSFDAIIASNVLHLLFEPEKAMKEIKRVVKTDGIVIVPTYCHGENLKSHLISRFMNFRGFRVRSRWSLKSFSWFIKKNGFTIIESKKFDGSIPLVYLACKPIKN